MAIDWDSLQQAEVKATWWGDEWGGTGHVRVVCPFCQGTHLHAIGPMEVGIRQVRMGDCQPPDSYWFVVVDTKTQE